MVDDWIKTVGVNYFNELTIWQYYRGDGEVARIIARKYGEQSEKKFDENLDLADELADVIFVIICLANQTGINLEKAIIKNLGKKTKRDAQRHVENKKLSS